MDALGVERANYDAPSSSSASRPPFWPIVVVVVGSNSYDVHLVQYLHIPATFAYEPLWRGIELGDEGELRNATAGIPEGFYLLLWRIAWNPRCCAWVTIVFFKPDRSSSYSRVLWFHRKGV
jgi:hypothetical protein